LSAALADVNGAGRPDLVLSSADFGDGPAGEPALSGAVVLLGNDDGSFQPAQLAFPSSPWGAGVFVIDVNGDGRADLVFSDPFGAGSTLLLGQGDATFEDAGVFDAASVLNVADLNVDGRPDAIVFGGVHLAAADGSSFGPLLSF